MSTALRWRDYGRNQAASCGAHLDGQVIVAPRGEGWTFRLDMFPNDSEPLIFGDIYISPERARAEAERQVEAWPSLIEGARRV